MVATVRQINFLETLVREREITDAEAEAAYTLFRDPSASAARGGPISQKLDELMRRPRRDRVATAPAGGRRVNPLVEHDVELASYALPVAGLPEEIRGLAWSNDFLFVEVKEFKGTRYLRKLTGAPGSFSRTRVPAAAVEVLARMLGNKEVAKGCSQLFGELYSVCGVCHAELTDPLSRELKLGPVCRGRFGL